MELLYKIRTIQTGLSIIIFTGVFIFCWYTTGFNILDIQLSYWGVESSSSTYWNGTLMGLAISLFFNVDFYVKNHIRMVNKKIIRILFGSVFLSLFLTGLIDMSHLLHDITAVYYFFLLPFVIYLMANLNKTAIQYKEWFGHIIFSTSMIVIPLFFIHMFKGMAVSEITHSSVVMLWSIWILKKELSQ